MDIGNELYRIYEKVMERDPSAVEEYKEILKDREQVWIDDTNTSNILPRKQWVINEIKNKPKEISILDIGSWTGSFANDIYNQGFKDITCLEIGEECVRVGKSTFPYLKWINADVEKTILIENQFDVILMCEIIEHLAQPLDTIEQVKTWLKPEGVILYTIPTEDTVFGESEGSALEHISEIKIEDLMPISNDISILNSDGFFKWYVGSIPKKNTKIKIAFIDPLGLKYNGDTLKERGLGGSESAVIYLSKELHTLGFDVTVFNKCEQEGIFDGVKYLDIKKSETNTNFDMAVCSRTCVPFLTGNKALTEARFKVLWLHDTFCQGDEYMEQLVINKQIDEIFTLSDWHTDYIGNGHNWRQRYFEVMKRHMWETRNGVHNYIEEVIIENKDKDLFVYNSSVSKGMVPLLEKVWPKVIENIPSAKLVIIGGYYRGANAGGPDEQENKFFALKDKHNGKSNILFTGIIKQNEIAEILSKASFMIYPAEFPETYGISTLEAINYNTPLLGCRFGALDEVAADGTSYLIDFDINRNEGQVAKFVQMVLKAHADKYLLQQKMYKCNAFKSFIGWDSVALQWKQHICKTLGFNLPVVEMKKVRKINRQVTENFNRRILNKEDIFDMFDSDSSQKKINIITPVYNAENYIEKCISSVMSQMYDNYTMYIIDDMSTDSTKDRAKQLIKDNDKFIYIENTEKKYALRNQVETIKNYCEDDSIIVLLDGDDWLVNDADIFSFLNREYKDGAKFTYGSCHSLVDNIDLIAQPYPKKVHEGKTYRSHLFNWGMPYTHLRTFEKAVFNLVDEEEFLDEEGNFYKAGGDNALFYPLIEKCNKDEIRCIQKILVNYNDLNSLNDYKVNGEEQSKNAKRIRGEEVVADIKKKRILIALPTAKNIETDTFLSIYRLEVPQGIETYLECFYGYNIDQVRNLICEFGIRNEFDYIFFVDSDIILPPDALKKLLLNDKDIISGVYIQRKLNGKIPEVYRKNNSGGRSNIDYQELIEDKLMEVDGCGFGCVLVKTKTLEQIGYPQFVYQDTLDFAYTISEDVYFCNKAQEKGFNIFVDSSIKCEHIGSVRLKI